VNTQLLTVPQKEGKDEQVFSCVHKNNIMGKGIDTRDVTSERYNFLRVYSALPGKGEQFLP
jgi:hypothetical protein